MQANSRKVGENTHPLYRYSSNSLVKRTIFPVLGSSNCCLKGQTRFCHRIGLNICTNRTITTQFLTRLACFGSGIGVTSKFPDALDEFIKCFFGFKNQQLSIVFSPSPRPTPPKNLLRFLFCYEYLHFFVTTFKFGINPTLRFLRCENILAPLRACPADRCSHEWAVQQKGY